MPDCMMVPNSCKVIWKPPSPMIATTVTILRAKLSADGCRQGKAHSAQTTAGHIAACFVELRVTASHHLVLANITYNYGIAFS